MRITTLFSKQKVSRPSDVSVRGVWDASCLRCTPCRDPCRGEGGLHQVFHGQWLQDPAYNISISSRACLDFICKIRPFVSICVCWQRPFWSVSTFLSHVLFDWKRLSLRRGLPLQRPRRL